MKSFFISVLILGWCAGYSCIYSQVLYQVDIAEKILNSSDIIEGRVIEQRSFWNPGHTMIFTANKIEVYKIFKGTSRSATIEVMTTGGTIGLERIEASDLLTLEKNNIGLFFCHPNSIHLLSPSTGNQLFDVYSSKQGWFTYDLKAQTASAPFVRYSSIENDLYKELVDKIGRKPTIVNPSFDVSIQARPHSPLAPVITSFSPQVVNAGAILDPANNLLTINGSGFGNTPADSSAVLFDDTNDGSGGNPFRVFFNSPLVQSWTDNQIKIRVPSRAGTGNFEVRDNLSLSALSPGILSINYAVSTSEITSGGLTLIKEINLMNDNGSGGYTVLYSTGTGGGGANLNLAPEKETFQRALNTWKEVAGFNVIEGGTTTIQALTGDGANVILFDNSNTGTTPLAAGVLAICYSYSNLCLPVTTNEVQKTEFDIVLRNNGVSSGSTSFVIGPCAPGNPYNQTDLETVLLHELGHALNLAHINGSYEGTSYPNINPGKLMNFAVLRGVSRKSPDYSALAGALYSINPQSNTYGSCSLSNIEMTPLTRTISALDECPLSFPGISTPPNTAINFDLVHATSNTFTDPAYNNINCAGTGTGVTNNAYYALRSDNDGGDLNIVVSGYTTFPATVQGTCTGAGVGFSLYQVNSCPAGQAYPSPLICRTITGNGSLPVITGLAPNSNYLIYVDGITNTKANFTLTLNGTVLPVSLLDFKGTILNNKVSLSWKTTREINSKEFLLEKSYDGGAFSTLAIFAAKGNGNIENMYGAIDDKPFSDYSFYRIKMVDKDGRFKYSGTIKVKTLERAIVITRIFPNPTSGKINFQIVADERKIITVEAFDLLGKKVANQNLTVEKGFNEKHVSVNALAAGNYFIQVKDSGGIVIEKWKFIKY